MSNLPQHITDKFYRTIRGDITLDEFEKWIYETKDIETVLKSDDYLNIISLNYKKSGAKYELFNLLKKQIDLGEFEKFKMLALLDEAKLRSDKLPFQLMQFYDLYCKGYNFLQDLGLSYGLAVECPRVNKTTAESWDKLPKQQQQELLDSFYPDLDEDIDRAKFWLTSNKIKLTGEQDINGHYEYVDFRTEDERKSKHWVTPVTNNSNYDYLSDKVNQSKQEKRKWWQLWK